MNTPILETERLLLRPFVKEDAKDVFECWANDPDVVKYMFWSCHENIEQTKEWLLFEIDQIEKDSWYRFSVVLKNDGRLIGTVLIYFEREVENWEIAYNFGKKYWGSGYATEAMRKVIKFAVNDLQISEIIGRYASENLRSGNVLKKLWFRYEKDIPYECNDGAVIRKGIQCKLICSSVFRSE